MFETLKRLFQEGKANEAKLTEAVHLEWITEEQKQEILGGK